MTWCKNCFGSVDMRRDTKCATCNSPLHKECAIKEDGASFCDVCYTVKEETKEKVNFEIPDVIRRTYIETYRTCPHKFFKEVIEGHTTPPTCYTQIGVDLHKLFEKAIHNRNYTRENMEEEYQEIWNAYPDDLFESDKQRETMKARVIESIDNFYYIIKDMPIPIMTEGTIHYSIGEDLPKVEFTMDVVLEVDGELELIDWKTGKVMVGQKLSTDLQAPLYIYGVKKHFNKPVRKFTFYYVNENKERVFERVNEDEYVCRVGKREYKISLTDSIREVKSVFSQIKKGNFNIPSDTRKMHFACKVCHLRQQGLCRGADEEAWYTQH